MISRVDQVLKYINRLFPLAHLVVDSATNIIETEEMWAVRVKTRHFFKTNDIRYRLHAFPEPYVVTDKKDYHIYLNRDVYDEELSSDYSSFRKKLYTQSDWEEISYSLKEDKKITNIISEKLLERVNSVWQGSRCPRNTNELLYSNFCNLLKKDVIKLAERALRHEGLNKSTIKLAISNIDNQGPVWYVGFQSETFIKTNKIQDMLSGNPVFLIDKQDGKIYDSGVSLDDFLHYKYGWFSEVKYKPLDL